MNISKGFWNKWIEDNEIERLELLRKLPCFVGQTFAKGMTVTLFNSYLEDLEQEVKDNEFYSKYYEG